MYMHSYLAKLKVYYVMAKKKKKWWKCTNIHWVYAQTRTQIISTLRNDKTNGNDVNARICMWEDTTHVYTKPT
jgi:hypothetical protein